MPDYFPRRRFIGNIRISTVTSNRRFRRPRGGIVNTYLRRSTGIWIYWICICDGDRAVLRAIRLAGIIGACNLVTGKNNVDNNARFRRFARRTFKFEMPLPIMRQVKLSFTICPNLRAHTFGHKIGRPRYLLKEITAGKGLRGGKAAVNLLNNPGLAVFSVVGLTEDWRQMAPYACGSFWAFLTVSKEGCGESTQW